MTNVIEVLRITDLLLFVLPALDEDERVST